MTKEEIVAEVDSGSREFLKSLEIEPTEKLMALMNASALRGFQMGARVARSMIEGGLIVHLAQVKAAAK